MLKTYLKKAQDDVVTLLDEKKILLDTLRNLQVSKPLWLLSWEYLKINLNFSI